MSATSISKGNMSKLLGNIVDLLRSIDDGIKTLIKLLQEQENDGTIRKENTRPPARRHKHYVNDQTGFKK